MNRDDIIRMAREAGFVVDELSKHYQPNCITHTYYLVDELLERFAALVAAREREQCARVVENCCSYCAERIRERDGKPREPVQCNISIEDVTKAALKILDTELTKQGLQP